MGILDGLYNDPQVQAKHGVTPEQKQPIDVWLPVWFTERVKVLPVRFASNAYFPRLLTGIFRVNQFSHENDLHLPTVL